ncbi:unnamed protein product [Eruca vesicaria subsp. sativa]|uniref:RRM domain-containing protein n=1 Tax=Eruca vesicaria subsp. sativa TaxID=29727 RepID=A0ABC8LD30_ERUVS|nr:unnamed protein product [Eruca vesicaria subsp. sativa]
MIEFVLIRSVKVGNLSSGTTEHNIKEFFSFCGEVESIDIQPNEHSAYVTFKDPQGVETAVLLSVGCEFCRPVSHH